MISSAPARRDTKLAIVDYFSSSRLHEMYGSTEAGFVTHLPPEEQLTKLGTVGRELTGSGAIRLLDPDRREVADGEVGELFSHTPYAFDGYWNDPEQTAQAWDGDWCSVGDLARRDADGYIELIDRKHNMIIRGGSNIYPSEVENLLGGHPAVQDVAVIGVPDEQWGEAVHAVIVRHSGNDATAAEILAWCNGRIATHKQPTSITFIADADMPRTATGKILHRTLRDAWRTSRQ
jgi:acyl-CoA synthetase (AMP-forming)/AMP-acid ligase II